MLTIKVEDDTLGAWSKDEEGPLAEGVVFWEQTHDRVVPRRVCYLERHRHTIQLSLQLRGLSYCSAHVVRENCMHQRDIICIRAKAYPLVRLEHPHELHRGGCERFLILRFVGKQVYLHQST